MIYAIVYVVMQLDMIMQVLFVCWAIPTNWAMLKSVFSHIFSGGRPEGSKRDLKFQRATWHNLMGWGVSSPNVRFCRLNICTKRPQSGVWMN
jgi:hypothetical protein